MQNAYQYRILRTKHRTLCSYSDWTNVPFVGLEVGREPGENMNNPQLWTKILIILVMNTRYLNGLLNYSFYLFPGSSRSHVDCVANMHAHIQACLLHSNKLDRKSRWWGNNWASCRILLLHKHLRITLYSKYIYDNE